MHSRVVHLAVAVVLGLSPTSIEAQAPPKAPAPRPAEDGDTISLIPTSIKETIVNLSHEGRSIEVPVQYSIRENTSQGRATLFVLPVWVVESVDRIVNGNKVRLSPNDPLIPQDEARLVQLNVYVRNLLDRPATEERIVDQLKSLVNKQLGLEAQALRYEKPHMDVSAVRFTLVGQGRGEETEIALSNAVRSADGLLGFDLDIAAIRRCEQLHAYTDGLALGNTSIMASGPIRVRFERLEVEAQLRYVREAAADLRKRIGSTVNPSGPPPDVIVSFKTEGVAEAHNWIMSTVRQFLRVELSRRVGATEPPLLFLLDRIASSCIRQVEIDQANEHQRLTLLLESQVGITATLGEFKRLSQLDKKARTAAFEQAKAHFEAHSRGEARKYQGELHVGYGPVKGGVRASHERQDQKSNTEMDQAAEKQFQQALDQLKKSFEGNLKLPTGLQIVESASDGQIKEFEAELAQRTFFVDYTLHRFAPIRLTGTTDLGTDANAWMRSYAQLRAEHQTVVDRLQQSAAEYEEVRNAVKTALGNLESVQKRQAELQARVEDLLKKAGQPEAWAAAKEQMDQVARKVAEVQQSVATLRKSLDDSAAAKLVKLEQEVDALRQSVRDFTLHFNQGLSNLIQHSAGVCCIAVSPDGKLVASGTLDNKIQLWSVISGKSIRTFSGYDGHVRSVAFSPDGKFLASGSDDNTIRLWTVKSGELLRKLTGHENWVRSTVFSPDGQYLASGSDDKTIRLWKVATGELVRTFSGHSGYVRSVAFSPDGQYLASGSDDKTIRLWKVATGELVRTFPGHTDWVLSVAFSPDGKYLASCSDDKTVRLWRVDNGGLVLRLCGHTSWIRSVAFSPDGKYLASGSNDKTIRLWSVERGELVRTLTGHTDEVWSIAFSPNGLFLVSGAMDKTIRLWPVEER